MSPTLTLTPERVVELFPYLKENTEAIEDLIAYEKDLSLLAKYDISIQFNNSGKEHAAIVMSKLFDHSYSHVKIFAGDFNGDICDNELYFESLMKYINNGKAIDIIFENDPNKESRTFNFLLQKSKDLNSKVTLSKATTEQIKSFRSLLVNKNKSIHFAIGDREDGVFNKYRCETDIDNYIAILNFDDTKFSAKLARSFEVLSKDATLVN